MWAAENNNSPFVTYSTYSISFDSHKPIAKIYSAVKLSPLTPSALITSCLHYSDIIDYATLSLFLPSFPHQAVSSQGL